MDNYEFIAPCHFGLEAVLKKEIINLGYEITKVEDGKVTFTGDASAVCRANIFLRTTERVLLKTGSFKATTFDGLLKEPKQFHGNSLYLKMESSGLQKPHQLKANFSARQTYNLL